MTGHAKAGGSVIQRKFQIVADAAASAMTLVERQGRPTTIPNWIVMVEGFTLAAVENAGAALSRCFA